MLRLLPCLFVIFLGLGGAGCASAPRTVLAEPEAAALARAALDTLEREACPRLLTPHVSASRAAWRRLHGPALGSPLHREARGAHARPRCRRPRLAVDGRGELGLRGPRVRLLLGVGACGALRLDRCGRRRGEPSRLDRQTARGARARDRQGRRQGKDPGLHAARRGLGARGAGTERPRDGRASFARA